MICSMLPMYLTSDCKGLHMWCQQHMPWRRSLGPYQNDIHPAFALQSVFRHFGCSSMLEALAACTLWQKLQRRCMTARRARPAGGYKLEEHAAEAYDVAALKCKGPGVKVNFDLQRCATRVLTCCRCYPYVCSTVLCGFVTPAMWLCGGKARTSGLQAIWYIACLHTTVKRGMSMYTATWLTVTVGPGSAVALL